MSFIIKTTLSFGGLSFRSNIPLVTAIQKREFAARKGTREKARKKKVKVEEKKVGFIPHNQRGLEKLLASRPKRKFDDSWKQLATDNVYPARYYRWRVYPFSEAIQCHRETHHPTMYNEPEAPVKVHIELDMTGDKKGRFIDNLHRVAPMPNSFDHGDERNIVAFTRNTKLQESARELGAALAGGPELIRQIQNGDIPLQDIQYVVAHPDILAELVALRGLLRKKFPNSKNGTLSTDLDAAVKKFLHGVTYSAIKDEHEQDFGLVETTIGLLDMDAKLLEENFASLITDLESARPKRSGPFITRSLLICPPSSEKLKVDHNLYISTKKEEAEDDDDDKIAIAA